MSAAIGFFILSAFFWIICGLAAGLIAEKKGHSGCLFLIVGLALGPLGLGIAALVSPNEENLAKMKMKQGYARKCPYCSEIINHDARICKYCRSEVDPLEDPPKFLDVLSDVLHRRR